MRGFATTTILFLSCLVSVIPETAIAESALFTESHPLKLEMIIDLKKLCRLKDQSQCEDVPASLNLYSETGAIQNIPVKVRARGNWRLSTANCTVPPMFLLFEDGADDSLLAGQEMLPLTTHCKNLGYYEDYVLKEYLAYRIYSLLTKKSVRTRLVQITYQKPLGKRRKQSHNAFLSEHFRFMADRNGAEMWKTDKVDFNAFNPMEVASMDLFQYMIGHTDWSTIAQHNVVLIHQQGLADNAGVSIVPFDFDFSGLVSAHYAGPPPGLPIRSVRQRLYRGFCNPGIDWEALFTRFQDIRTEVFELVASLPGLSRKALRRTRAYLEDFYDILDSPKQREKRIIEACR